MLCYTSIPHQTTTSGRLCFRWFRCVIFLFYIKPQRIRKARDFGRVVLYPYSISNRNCGAWRWGSPKLYYIPILHQTTTMLIGINLVDLLCYISILHQTTTLKWYLPPPRSCVIFLFHIKPQLSLVDRCPYLVVLYFYSTSNHNFYLHLQRAHDVVLYSYSTSNHNYVQRQKYEKMLCYILILHQTTTSPFVVKKSCLLCYISILHQTTTTSIDEAMTQGCVIFLFYIKPQHKRIRYVVKYVVLYFYSTSNHNLGVIIHIMPMLCYISILHQTTTQNRRLRFSSWLCYISILHQTTTSELAGRCTSGCVIFLFYIKPQPCSSRVISNICGGIFLVYIKPQP